MYWFINRPTCKILNDKRFGFRSKHSTYMAIIELVDEINTAVGGGTETTTGIFLDLSNMSKAFDNIDHGILLYKLDHYGFRCIVLTWFENYLIEDNMYPIIHMSRNSEDIVCGVPQGPITSFHTKHSKKVSAPSNID